MAVFSLNRPNSRNDQAMPNTGIHTKRDQLRQEIERLVGRHDASIPQAFAQAVRSFLAAMDYNDSVLMRSHLEEALEALQQVVCDAIDRRLGLPQQARETCREVGDLLKGCATEDCDEPGRRLESYFDELLRGLTDLRDGVVRLLQQHGREVENADRLDRAIEELQALKDSVLAEWPWSDRELPPVDWGMVEASQEARRQGEGESIEDLIRRWGGEPTRGE